MNGYTAVHIMKLFLKNYLSVSKQIIIFATEYYSYHNKKLKTIPSSMKIITIVYKVTINNCG